MTSLTRRGALLALAGVSLVACKSGPPLRPAKGVPGGQILSTEDGDVPIDDQDPQSGPRDARVVVVVFSDFQCSFCAEASDAIRAARAKKAFRLVFKHLPLPRHDRARALALATQAVFLAKGEAAFWALHDRIFASRGMEPTGDELAAWVADAGATSADIERVADGAARRVLEDLALARALKIDGAPQLYVNRRSLSGAPTVDELLAAMD